ncbi:MAG: transglycosylase SLT domain-containing protein [Burkholderiales bacterium]|nr:transglycosylase SLT domain-containing protein [Burkholderiales bacterium]
MEACTRMRRGTAALAAVLTFAAPAWAGEPAPAPKARGLALENKPWKGDFDAMLEARRIRVLVPYSRTLYFNDKGRERGVIADLVRDFERYLNKTHAKRLGKRPLTVVIIPTTRDELLPGVANGLGDIAAGNLTVTEARLKIVDFVTPTGRKQLTQELVVTGPRSPAIGSIEELSGKRVDVRPSSSYHESLVALNERLKKSGKPPVAIVALPDELEDEDILEMLNAGLFEFAVVDDWKARMWAQVLPKIRVREDLVLRADAEIGWAIRKGSPQLARAAADFYANFLKAQGGIEARLAHYHKRVRQITNNTATAEYKRFEATVRLFEVYGTRYGFDPLMLAAQGYQESQLKQEARSHVGAIGVMQVMPATGKDLRVGDINQVEPNIHAGAKYMDQLMSRYFPDAKFSERDRPLFAFASYNAGPGNISKYRKEAAKRGLDPDKWFNNVELVVAERIGMETTTYVRNIYKYYAAYRLTRDAQRAAQAAREKLKGRT